MIASIQGILASAGPLRAVIELNGLGYEVHIPVTTAERLPAPGASVRLHTHVVYREDAQTIYGFSNPAERDFFRLMIENVTGVGPKLALTIMSKLSLPLLEAAIRDGDVGLLSKCPGIGRKTAERLVIELKSRLGGAGLNAHSGATETEAPPATGSAQRDAVAALLALGYKAPDADAAVRQAARNLGLNATTEQLVKKALA